MSRKRHLKKSNIQNYIMDTAHFEFIGFSTAFKTLGKNFLEIIFQKIAYSNLRS